MISKNKSGLYLKYLSGKVMTSVLKGALQEVTQIVGT